MTSDVSDQIYFGRFWTKKKNTQTAISRKIVLRWPSVLVPTLPPRGWSPLPPPRPSPRSSSAPPWMILVVFGIWSQLLCLLGFRLWWVYLVAPIFPWKRSPCMFVKALKDASNTLTIRVAALFNDFEAFHKILCLYKQLRKCWFINISLRTQEKM